MTQAKQKTLYETDFSLWIEDTVNQLKIGDFQQIDLENLIEELEAMGRSEKHSLESNLIVILLHLLKYKYQQKKRSKSWLSSIIQHRRRVKRSFKDSPSLKRYYLEVFAECYQNARKLASAETGLSLNIFPVTSPFSEEETLNDEFFPE